MLILIALVAWSAASVASAMPNGVISSGNDSSPWNVTRSPIAGSNADMSSYTDNAEERAPEEFGTVLGKWILSKSSSKNLLGTDADTQLIEHIKAMNTKFSELIGPKKNDDIFEGDSIVLWNKFVNGRYLGDKETGAKAMFVLLASHFQDDVLTKALVAGATNTDDTKKHIAAKLIDVQVEKWVNLKEDSKNVFELLRLDQPGNPIENPLFVKWIKFVTSRYTKQPLEKALSDLAIHFKNDDVALGKALVMGTKKALVTGTKKALVTGTKKALVTGTKGTGTAQIALKLLNIQVEKWATGETKKEPEWIFKLLELRQTGDQLIVSPLFPTLRLFFKKAYTDYFDKRMLMFLAKFYKPEELARILVMPYSLNQQLAMVLLRIQTELWNEAQTSDEEIFQYLQIHQANGNVLERPLFFYWVNILRERYSTGEDIDVKIHTILTKYCKGDDLIPFLAELTKKKNLKELAIQRPHSLIDELKKDATGLSKEPKRHNVELGESSSQKRQKVGSNESPAEIGLESSRLKRQKSFDLNELPPETEVNSNMPPRED